MKLETMRIDKYISGQVSGLSRSKVKALCKKGEISVNGSIVTDSDKKIIAGSDVVCVQGKEIVYKKNIYIMLNKPQGYVCSTHDGKSPTVLELVPSELYRDGLFPAGRLDKNTEGFVLLTDDGELSHKMLSPKNHVEKKYYTELKYPVEEYYINEFEKGMKIDSGDVCLPARLEFVSDNRYACYVYLNEGMYHQVKRMFESLSNKVTFLKRVKIGGLELDKNLEPGECLELLHKDVEKILLP